LPSQIFLLSPAHCGGERANLLLRTQAVFPLATQVRALEGAPLGEVFSFLSGLYFRGKLAYSRAFARPPRGLPGALVITPSEGLRFPDERVTADRLRGWAEVDIDLAEPRGVIGDFGVVVAHRRFGIGNLLGGEAKQLLARDKQKRKPGKPHPKKRSRK